MIQLIDQFRWQYVEKFIAHSKAATIRVVIIKIVTEQL